MVKCPFCQYANEDGALFCEQCKSDLGVLEAPPLPTVEQSAAFIRTFTGTAEVEAANPFNELDRPVPVATPVGSMQEPGVEAVPVAAAVFPARPVPLARPIEAPLSETPKADTGTPDKAGLEPPPPVPVSIIGPATISSLETFTPPSHTPPPATSPPASPITKDTDLLPMGGKPRLRVLRGQRINVEYPLYEGDNFIGRADEKPVDIDLEDQELPDRIWSSRQHALIHVENGSLVIEDLNSSNGTFINRTRLYPGQKRVLNVNDIIQIGTVQMRVLS